MSVDKGWLQNLSTALVPHQKNNKIKQNNMAYFTLQSRVILFLNSIALLDILLCTFAIDRQFVTVDLQYLCIVSATEYGRPMKPFFIELLKLDRQILGHLLYFWSKYQQPCWYSESLVHIFIIQPLLLQKTKPLYPHLKYLFGIGIWIWIWR